MIPGVHDHARLPSMYGGLELGQDAYQVVIGLPGTRSPRERLRAVCILETILGTLVRQGLAPRIELQAAEHVEGRDVWILHPPKGPVSGTDCGPGTQPAPGKCQDTSD